MDATIKKQERIDALLDDVDLNAYIAAKTTARPFVLDSTSRPRGSGWGK